MNKLIFLCLGTASLAGAFYLGRLTAPEVPASAVSMATETSVASVQPVAKETVAPRPVQAAPQVATQITSASPEQPSYQRDWLHMQTLLELARTAPEAALEQTRQLKGELQQEAQAKILALWGQTNPALAWRWLESNQPHNSPAFIALIGAIAITQPTATLDLADRYAQSQSPIKKDIYQAAIQGLARGGHYDPAVFLLDYLDQNDGFRQDLTRALVEQWATYQPQSALEWLIQQPLPVGETPPGRAGAIPNDKPNNTALDDARQQQHQLLEDAFSQWLSADEMAAASWLGSQNPSPELDSLFGVTAMVPGNDPARAFAAAGRIQNTPLKLNVLLSVLSPIKQADPNQAKAYIERLDYLNDSQRSSLKRSLALTP